MLKGNSFLRTTLVVGILVLAACQSENASDSDAAPPKDPGSDTGTIPGDEQADVPIDGVEDSGQDSPDTNSGSDAVEEPPHDSSDPPLDSRLDIVVPDAVPDTMVPDAVPDTPSEETDSGLSWGCVMTSDEDGDPLCVCSDPPIEGDLVDPKDCSVRWVDEAAGKSFFCELDAATHICTCRTVVTGSDPDGTFFVRGCAMTYLCPDDLVEDKEACEREGDGYYCPALRVCSDTECWCTEQDRFACEGTSCGTI